MSDARAGTDRPRIGLTASNACDTAGARHPDVRPYVRAIERFGGEVIVLPNDAERVDALLANLDGVVVSGGIDVDPARYGGAAEHSRSERGSYRADRDAFEIALVRRLRERQLPTLGICRGLQIANVAFGGTLIEDLVDTLVPPSPIDHRQTSDTGIARSDYAPGHIVTVAADSAFARLVGCESFRVNSMHHQAIRTIGDGLAVVAATSDGVVEAAEAIFHHPFFYAVQWHPEELDDDVSAALFGGLVAAASSARAAAVTAPVPSDG